MPSSSTPTAKNLKGAAAAAASPSWTPTGGRAIMIRGPLVSTGMYYLEVRYDPRTGSKSSDRKSITSLHEDYPGKPSFLMGLCPRKSWRTIAAAEAAIDHFRTWVDERRRKRTAAAAEVSNARILGDETVLPERFSERNLVTRVEAATWPYPSDKNGGWRCHLKPSGSPTTVGNVQEAWFFEKRTAKEDRPLRANYT